MPFDKETILPERHLGLVPSIEQELSKSLYRKIGDVLQKNTDIHKIIDIASSGEDIPPYEKRIFTDIKEQYRLRIAVAMDEAFSFYYHDNLDLLEMHGVELTYFSPLHDKYVPADVNAIYFGGGFPELQAPLLASNTTMKESVRKAYRNGVFFYGECGGMMYLLEHMVGFDKKYYEMCGIFKGITRMEEKRQGLGYINVRAMHDNLICKKSTTFKAHEFHWSSLQQIPEDTSFAYAISKHGTDGYKTDGLFNKKALCSYVHIHFATDDSIVEHLLQTIKGV